MSWFGSLPDEYVLCRSLGHLWAEGALSAFSVKVQGRKGEVLTCTRCKTQRFTVFDQTTGRSVYRRYKYPAGYQKPANEESIPRAAFTKARLAMATRVEVPPEWFAIADLFKHKELEHT